MTLCLECINILEYDGLNLIGVILIFAFRALLPSLQKTEEVITQEDGNVKWKNDCWKTREDYFECLHAKKEWAMVKRVSEEEAKQAAVAAGR